MARTNKINIKVKKRMKELGMWFRAYPEDGMEGYVMALLTRILKVSCSPFLFASYVPEPIVGWYSSSGATLMPKFSLHN
jgi:hypothetical protein